MMTTPEQWDEMYHEAYTQPNHVRVPLFEELIRRADVMQDKGRGWRARESLINTTYYTDEVDKMLVAFSWQLAQSDAEPERFPISSLMWTYKWILLNSPLFHQIAKERIIGLLDDFYERTQALGGNLRAYHSLRCMIAKDLGEAEMAEEAAETWQITPRGWNSDCIACDLDNYVNYLFWKGRYEEAIECSEPLLAQQEGCSEVPHMTYAHVILPLLSLGRLEEALTYQKTGQPLVEGDAKMIMECGQHAYFLALRGEATRAVGLLENTIENAIQHSAVSKRMWFYAYAASTLHVIKTPQLKMKLHPKAPGYREDASYDTQSLMEAFEREAMRLAHLYDQRNQNTSISDGIKDIKRYDAFAG